MNIKFIPVSEKDSDDVNSSSSKKEPLVTQNIDNPLVENVYEINNFDNAYTETQTDPNPKPKSRGLELD